MDFNFNSPEKQMDNVARELIETVHYEFYHNVMLFIVRITRENSCLMPVEFTVYLNNDRSFDELETLEDAITKGRMAIDNFSI